MARFDVYRNESASVRRFPYLLAVQPDLFESLATNVVVPLGRSSVVGGRPAETLTPTLDVDGASMVMYTPQIAAVNKSLLKHRVCNLAAQRDTIVRALEFLFSGA